MSDVFPLDFTVLEKGMVIEQARIERIFNVSATKNPDGYRRAMMELGGRIERECHDRGLLYRCDGYDLRIMTDEEAETRTWERIREGARAISRNTKRRAVIDRSAFSDLQKTVAEHRDRAATSVILAQRRELRRAERDTRQLASPKRKV